MLKKVIGIHDATLIKMNFHVPLQKIIWGVSRLSSDESPV